MTDNSGSPEYPLGPPTLFGLMRIFATIGVLSFGGGLIAWVYREIVLLRRWISETDFMSGVAMAQILPGTNIGNMTVFVGQRLFGVSGSALALLALLIGPFFFVLALLAVYQVVIDFPGVATFLEGVTAAAVGLVLYTGLIGARRMVGRPASLMVIAATFVAIGLLQWPLLPVVAVLAPISVALSWPRSTDAARG